VKRPYLRVTPGEEPIVPRDIPDTITSLHKLSKSDSRSLLHRLNPFHSQPPLRFEFVALSEGEGQPVKFYYGADHHLDALEQRLRSIYPASYNLDSVEVDVTKRLVRPVAYTREEYTERLQDDRLYYESTACAGDGRTTVSDGGDAAVEPSQPADARRPPEVEETPDGSNTEVSLDRIDLAPSSTYDEDEPLTALEKPTATDDGHILARPPLAEVEPYGVQWYGAAERRKDWMTTLTGLTDFLADERSSADERVGRAQLPLAPLIKHLVETPMPVAFQVVFQRNPDWSRDARRRTGELLDGTDTLLQKILGFESSGRGRLSASNGRSTRSTRRTTSSSHPRRTRLPTGEGPSRPASVDEATRYDLVRANSPKRTFSVNLRLLALAVNDDASEEIDAHLNPLCSVFDLVDGRFYEMDGRRLRSHGYLPGSGERHARAVYERFTSRSIAIGGNRFAITNRSETRPDLVLNGDELANFLVIPPSHDIPSPSTESVDDSEPDPTAVEVPSVEIDGTESESAESDGTGRVTGAGPFSSVPEPVVHRSDEVNQLAAVLEPLTRGEQLDTILITGPPGSGKTCIATYTVDQFCQETSEVDAVYVNCWEDHSPFQTLYRILDELEGAADIHRQSTATDVILDRMRDYDEKHCVLILDEVDQLDDEDILYDLLNLPRFSLLLIANREENLLDGLDDRLASRLGGCERIHLDRYAEDELVDILDERAAAGSVSRDIKRSEFERIADAADGDARVAITTLRIAARRADEDAADRITQDLVERALPEARRELRQQHVDRLTSHQQAVFRVIEEQERIAPQELFEEYRSRVEEPKSNRTVRTYLKKLERYGLIVAEGSTRDRLYRCRESRPSSSSRSASHSE
jgi:Cdc6-like AAA superfamily ATPase